ncbi:hypothetical protein R1T43_03445 [Alteromonas sp. CI.11.F.A3]|uniref:hypothetical protein n=1 Tax=unclassified Alteromonas TaxID=2614992 RepID=UPI001B39F7BC|nr:MULTISPECIES: hypothetical protein [unclassified Alteromonas]MBQ4830974.1 hypothetical protein [Alteromonas sp. MMG017]WOI38104.1 hypothetical protein R1T43_03445 [Alteromonas sp. CI.11.F.A3]
MSTILRKLAPQKFVSKPTHPVCNYANNYYGDQICVAQKNPTTKTRISGAA